MMMKYLHRLPWIHKARSLCVSDMMDGTNEQGRHYGIFVSPLMIGKVLPTIALCIVPLKNGKVLLAIALCVVPLKNGKVLLSIALCVAVSLWGATRIIMVLVCWKYLGQNGLEHNFFKNQFHSWQMMVGEVTSASHLAHERSRRKEANWMLQKYMFGYTLLYNCNV